MNRLCNGHKGQFGVAKITEKGNITHDPILRLICQTILGPTLCDPQRRKELELWGVWSNSSSPGPESQGDLDAAGKACTVLQGWRRKLLALPEGGAVGTRSTCRKGKVPRMPCVSPGQRPLWAEPRSNGPAPECLLPWKLRWVEIGRVRLRRLCSWRQVGVVTPRLGREGGLWLPGHKAWSGSSGRRRRRPGRSDWLEAAALA